MVYVCPQAENKVKQEAEARRRAEEQAKKAAAAQAALAMQAQQSLGNVGAEYSMRNPMNKGMGKGVSHAADCSSFSFYVYGPLRCGALSPFILVA